MEAKYRDRKAKWRAMHPNRDRAQRIAQNENARLRRRGQQRTCEVCGLDGAEAHHTSYSFNGENSPVQNLCKKCHQAEHRRDGTGQACAQKSTRNTHEGGLIHHDGHDIRGALRFRP